MKKRVADIIMEVLQENGIEDCFCVVGGGSMQLNNALAKCEGIHKYYNHHEQACAMAAEGYVKARGKMPVVCVTSGPGGTNTLTGVLCAWQDSVPMLVLSGQVRYEISVPESGLQLRQRGEQEFQIVPVVSHMTKYARMIVNPLSIKQELQKAINIATSGRRGPVWLDIPLNVQGALVEEDELLPVLPDAEKIPCVSGDEIEFLNKIFAEAKRPCVLVGSGVRATDTVKEFRRYVELLGVPVVAGIHVADAHYSDYPLYFGMSGTIGPRLGNFVLQNADIIVTIGNSLHICETGFEQKEFAPNAKIIMIDIDQNEAMKPGLNIYRFIQTDLKMFFDKALPLTKHVNVNADWIQHCNMLRARFPMIEVPLDLDMNGPVRQNYFWTVFEKYAPKDCIVAYGNSMGVAGVVQKGINYPEQRLIANFWVGTMGNDLPEAIGASIGAKKEVVCATGDGSIMMNLQELQTIIHYNLPIKIILFNNGGYGTIRQTCKNFFEGVMVGCDSESGVGMPDFEKVAKAFGYHYKKCETNTQADESLQWLFSTEGCVFLEVVQDFDDAYEPKLKSRLLPDNTFATPALHDMYPFIEKDELDRYILWNNENK